MSAISAITTGARRACTQIGQNMKSGKGLQKAAKFFEADGFNMNTIAFNTLLLSAVIGPRILQARDADERREILTRDSITILTILFAMKGLKAGFSKLMTKPTGLVLAKDGPNTKNCKNIFSKFYDYIRPSGVAAMSSEQIASKYGNITSKEDLTKLVKFLGENGGDPSKALNLNRELSEVTTEALGDIKGKGAKEIIELIEKDTNGKVNNLIKKLTDINNPLTKAGKRVNAWFQAGSLGLVVSFIGFGLPALNKKLTTKNHQKNTQLNNAALPRPLFNNNYTQLQRETFKDFIG